MKTIAVLLFDGVNALDVAGPLEAFAAVRDESGAPAYAVTCFSLDSGAVTAESGLSLNAAPITDIAARADLLIVPGGAGLQDPARRLRAANWLRRNQARFDRIASICTGAYALAESRLWDGRSITTHWRFAKDLAARYPRIDVRPDVLFLESGKYYSSGGIAAGIDLALALIERDHGARAAAGVARELVVFLRRTGAQTQYSNPLKMQFAASDRLSDVCAWIANNLSADLSVTALARRANLSPRHFSRLFAEEFGAPPAHYIMRLRLDSARDALGQNGASVNQAARLCGFASPDGFRRAFERRFGINPGEYQRRFSLKEQAS